MMLIGSMKLPVNLSHISSFNQLMNLGHVLLHLPYLLESFTAKLASQLFLVNFPLLSVVDVFDMGSDIVRIEKAFSADRARIISLACVRFHVSLHLRLCVRSEATNSANDVLFLLMYKHVFTKRGISGVTFTWNQ